VLKPVFDALVHRGVRDMFAMCLGAQGGVLMIGGMNEKYLLPEAVVNYATMDVATYRMPITQLMVEQSTSRALTCDMFTSCQSVIVRSIHGAQY
jgi:hypothetical protein